MSTKKFSLALLIILTLSMLSATMVAGQDTLELQMTWWGSQNRHDRTIAVIEAYEAENPGIDIVYEFSNFTDYWPLLQTKAAAGQLPCIMQHDYAFLAEWANRGLLLPLNPYFEDGTIDVSNVAQSIIDSGSIDGQAYGLSLGTNSPALILDVDQFEAAGLELPPTDWTFADFEQIANQLHEELGIWAISYGMFDPQFWRGIYISRGEWIFNEEGTGLGYEDDQPFIDYLNMLIRLQESGAIATAEEAVEASANGHENSPIVTGGEAMRYQWSNQVVSIFAAAGEGRNFRLWPLPRPEGGASANYLKPSMFFSIPSQCQNPDEAAAFINYFTNDLEANEILFAERGVPISTEVQEHLRPMLDTVGTETFDFIATVAEDASPVPPPEPQGWSDLSA
ncbi:MAG TPA: extracellular solute-binding protein, partial [Oceanobacillus sp.]|nr:extracellular solute-binding protein [Oceanobacillus sp.]